MAEQFIENQRLRAAGAVIDVAVAVDDALVSPLAQHPRLRGLLLHVLSHLNEKLLSAQAAKIVNLEPKYFSKFFHRETGFHFSYWNREIRISIAAYLLTQRGRKVDSVAIEVGYGDQTTFTRAFKKSNGVGPREFRRLCVTRRT